MGNSDSQPQQHNPPQPNYQPRYNAPLNGESVPVPVIRRISNSNPPAPATTASASSIVSQHNVATPVVDKAAVIAKAAVITKPAAVTPPRPPPPPPVAVVVAPTPTATPLKKQLMSGGVPRARPRSASSAITGGNSNSVAPVAAALALTKVLAPVSPQKGHGLPVLRFPKHSFCAGKSIGQGAFGTVITGTLDGKFVISKVLHSPVSKKKMQVLQHMMILDHRNVLKFLGMIDLDINESRCPQLLFKHVNKSNLLQWLKEAKGPYDERALNKFGCDVINAMEYLHNLEFVHGCLCARNILLDEFHHKSGAIYLNAKVSDYGMTRVLEGKGVNYVQMPSNAKVIPIRWMPKEVVTEGKNGSPGEVTYASDMWSFGVLLWEIWTKGDVPYGVTMSDSEIRSHILNGSNPLTFLRPSVVSPPVLNVMENAFKVNQKERPTFISLRQRFDSLRFSTQPYKLPEKDRENKPQQRTSRGSRSTSKTMEAPKYHFPRQQLEKRYKTNQPNFPRGRSPEPVQSSNYLSQHWKKQDPSDCQGASGDNTPPSYTVAVTSSGPGARGFNRDPSVPLSQYQCAGTEPKVGLLPTPYHHPGGAGSSGPPPPYALATGVPENLTGEWRTRDLPLQLAEVKNQLLSLEMKQLQQKLDGLTVDRERQASDNINNGGRGRRPVVCHSGKPKSNTDSHRNRGRGTRGRRVATSSGSGHGGDRGRGRVGHLNQQRPVAAVQTQPNGMPSSSTDFQLMVNSISNATVAAMSAGVAVGSQNQHNNGSDRRQNNQFTDGRGEPFPIHGWLGTDD